jgi:anti-sigma factor RsiW
MASELDLHAYADGQLEPARRAEIEAYLAAHPEAALSVEAIRAQTLALHRGFDGILNEPVPPRLTGALRQPAWRRQLVAGCAWLACGLAAGWFAHGALRPAPPPSAAFAREALAAHVLFAVEQRHPVEVPAAQEAHLVAWLSKRLAAPIRAPQLQPQGFALLGGRLLPGPDSPLAQLMYESARGERLTLTVRHAKAGGAETGFKIIERDGASAFYWIDGDYGYALSGALDKARLLAVAQAVDRQLRR